MPNAQAPATTKNATVGNHGATYAILRNSTLTGRPPHPHAVAPRDCDKKNKDKKHPPERRVLICGGCDWTRTNDLFDVNEAL